MLKLNRGNPPFLIHQEVSSTLNPAANSAVVRTNLPPYSHAHPACHRSDKIRVNAARRTNELYCDPMCTIVLTLTSNCASDEYFLLYAIIMLECCEKVFPIWVESKGCSMTTGKGSQPAPSSGVFRLAILEHWAARERSRTTRIA